MRKLFNNILNAESPVSSRRFVALVALALFAAVVIVKMVGVDVDNEVMYTTSGLALTCLGLSTLRK